MGSTIIMMFLPCLLLALASSALGQMTECFEVTSAVCPDGDMVRDLGMTGGCWNGNYCMPQGSVCPPACYSPLPSECSGTDIPCDMGMHGDCWNGDYCMPEGTICPPACQKVLSALNPAAPLHLQCVVPQMSDVTVASLAVAGMEITACPKDQSAPRHATPQSPQYAQAPLMLYVT